LEPGETKPRANSPEIRVEELRRSGGNGSWRFHWRIHNCTGHAMKILSARLPHGKFLSAERLFEPPRTVPARDIAVIEMPAACNETPGTVVENAFIILLVEWLKNKWRIFVRLRIEISQAGEPESQTELITTQRVGFSGID
jgi:hypothetical protein